VRGACLHVNLPFSHFLVQHSKAWRPLPNNLRHSNQFKFDSHLSLSRIGRTWGTEVPGGPKSVQSSQVKRIQWRYHPLKSLGICRQQYTP
jgi:hypothetical protein